MTAVHDGDMARCAFQKVVECFTIDVEPRRGDQVIEVGIIFLHVVPVLKKPPETFLSEVRVDCKKEILSGFMGGQDERV